MTAHKTGTLCFLHGWGMDKRAWGDFVDGFMPGRDVKILELPGYDGAAPVAPGMDEIARTVAAGVPENSTLIGWSLGGMLGIRIAAMRSIRQLILLASSPCFVKKDDWTCGTEVKVIENLKGRVHDNPARALQEFALLSSRGDRRPRTTYQALSGMLSANRIHKNALLDGLDILLQADLRAEFSRLKCRTGAILAARDLLLPVAAGAAMRALRPDVGLEIIEGAGHAPMISCPRETRRALLDLLESGVAA